MKKDFMLDMTKGSPIKLLLSFSLPMLLGNMFQQFYNMIDAAIVGKYVGPNALAAVGATGSISFLFFSLSFGLASGIGIIVSQFYGAGDEKNVRRTISTSIAVMLVSSLTMGLLGFILARPIMVLLNTPAEIIEDAIIYMQVGCLGLIAIALYNGVASILRALGDSLTPLIFLVIACFGNILLDYIFVVYFGLGVLGTALATIIMQIIAGIGCSIFAWKTSPLFRMPFKDYFRVEIDILKKCLGLGVPVAFQSAMIAISCIVLQRVVNGFGATIVAAFTAETRFEQLIQQPFSSLGAAIATYTGQNVGAGNIKRVRAGFWSGVLISTAFSVAMLPVAWLGGESIMRFFTHDAQVILEGARGIRITSVFYSALGMIYVTRNVLNGSGDVRFAMLSGFVEVGSRVGFAKPLTLLPSIGMLSIWYTTGLTWLLTAAVSCIRYAQGKWKEKGVIQSKEENIINEY